MISLDPGAGEPTYKKGIDEYYHKETHPGYASSYLLTGILSADYLDKTNDGITEDDLGTGMKFNYSRIDNYKWRTPYAARKTKLDALKDSCAQPWIACRS